MYFSRTYCNKTWVHLQRRQLFIGDWCRFMRLWSNSFVIIIIWKKSAIDDLARILWWFSYHNSKVHFTEAIRFGTNIVIESDVRFSWCGSDINWLYAHLQQLLFKFWWQHYFWGAAFCTNFVFTGTCKKWVYITKIDLSFINYCVLA